VKFITRSSKPDDSGSTAFLQQLLIRLPEVRSVVEPFQTFAALVRERRAQELDPWMQMALQSTCNALRQFARGLQQDEATVQAALTVEWSNGQAEGQVNRLKLLKRQMYGRAKFDLLRLRVLSPILWHEIRG
jgi:transposase